MKNCMTAHAVAKMPMTVAACAIFPPTKPAMSFGSTGPIMPNVSMSSVTVMKMNAVAARRCGRESGDVIVHLFRRGSVIEHREPELDRAVDARAVVRRA